MSAVGLSRINTREKPPRISIDTPVSTEAHVDNAHSRSTSQRSNNIQSIDFNNLNHDHDHHSHRCQTIPTTSHGTTQSYEPSLGSEPSRFEHGRFDNDGRGHRPDHHSQHSESGEVQEITATKNDSGATGQHGFDLGNVVLGNIGKDVPPRRGTFSTEDLVRELERAKIVAVP